MTDQPRPDGSATGRSSLAAITPAQRFVEQRGELTRRYPALRHLPQRTLTEQNAQVEERAGFVQEAHLALVPGVDTREPGGVVTLALCGAVEHEGSCRWPHNSAIDASHTPALFRTVFVCLAGDSDQVRERIDNAWRTDPGWAFASSGPGEMNQPERELASRLTRAV